ncbi:Crp/Fnr family transcriptional regulator [Hydrogenophaga crassostreae]|uniref:Crp/Fnr family transcriptional regulator n=1 Tax=Hydrogenophaga crassostreae TaxID=1763535 RepID=A0A167HFD9_9BURK|nr:Crp/Fnr family transcriptional regulator [Hydrogenophaga crassostreae]AOW12160.1 Crp/Fnr family transcriptional regulator [Hydrogenophaga crassostreae]OAD41105.1 Crp/Fnr family transcriptional regulator [Hydrogenophaga crassostreae]
MNRNRVDILAELSRSSVLKLKSIGIRRHYQDNQAVQQRGDLPNHALILISGRLRAVLHTANGTEQLSRWQEAGEISGIGSVLADTPVPVDLIAAGAVEVLILPKQPFMDFLASDAAACIILMRTLTLRVNELFDISFVRAANTLRDRVWATLQRLANENGERLSDDRTALRMSQNDVARAVGASRQRVNEELRKLEAEKKVVLGYRRLEIVDPH